jgi:Na+/melibiose symporter-like transporter
MSDKSCLIEKNVAVEQSDDTTQYYQQQNPQNSSNSNHPRNYGSIQTPDLPSSNNIDNSDSNYISNDGEMDNSRATLKFVEKIGFSLGHVYNDLAAGVWFSYTLLFFQGVLNMSSVMAGCLVMLGQVGDAICTPIVGIITDRFGTKRNWHIFGSILTLITFPMIFAICPFCDQFPLWWQPVYFSIVILIFQFGWPIIQVSHLSMVNELSRTQRDRGDLTASKYSMSVISNIVVYCVTWAVLRAHNSLDNKVSPSDYPKFRVSFPLTFFSRDYKLLFFLQDIALILTLIGASMTVLFYFSLALSNYDYRRLLSSTQRGNVSITHTTTNSHPGDTERLLGTEPSSSNGALITNKSNGHVPSQVAIVVPKKNFLKSPLLYLNSLL